MDNSSSRRALPRRPATRRLVQLYAALLYNANLKGFLTGKLYTGNTKALCVPGLNCYSCPGAVAACPLGSLQNALAASGHRAGWYVFGILLLFGITLGRTVCGWLCPVGLVQELLHKFPTPKIRKSKATRILSLLKYVVLAVFVIAIPLYAGLADNLPLPAFCKYICPAGTSEGALPLLAHPENDSLYAQLGTLFTNKFVILMILVLACVFCYRAFCRFLCPLGAIYGLFNRFSLAGVRVDPGRCNGCGACVRHCPMDIKHVSDRECIACGKCMDHCAQGAISIRCGKLTLKGPETGIAGGNDSSPKKRRTAGRVAWSILLAFLAFALLWFNVLDKPAGNSPAEAEEDSHSVSVGCEVGQQFPDFTCTLTDGSVFRLSDCRGKVVLLNQWAVYCTPCVAELPLFERLQQENPEVVVLAFHQWPELSPTAADYITQQGWDSWQTKFAVDTEEQELLKLIGGNNTMPRTVVISPGGTVVYNEQRSVTWEMLQSLLEKAQENN